MAITLRQEKRQDAMRRVQSEALDLFEARGFAGVTIEEIAAAARVSAPTVYRHFGTKEQIVFWDEYDPLLFAAIGERLRAMPVLDAVADSLGTSLDQIYAQDGARILRRVRLIRREPALTATAAANSAQMRRALAQLVAPACDDALEAEVVAGALVVALEAAVNHWADKHGKTPLRTVLRSALHRLRKLGRASSRA